MATKLTTVDIETIPPGKLEDYLLKKSAPKNLKKENIQKWEEDQRELEFRNLAKNPTTAYIICIGLSIEDENNLEEEPDYKVLYGENEEELLIEFEKLIKEGLSETNEDGGEKEITHDIRWMGYNIRKYDLEALWIKAIKYNLYFLAKLIPRNRYDNSVYDLMEKINGPRLDFMSYDTAMKTFNIGKKTDDMDGSKVYDEYMKGNLRSVIAPYCVDDIVGNRKMYKKINKGIIS